MKHLIILLAFCIASTNAYSCVTVNKDKYTVDSSGSVQTAKKKDKKPKDVLPARAKNVRK